MKQIKVVGAVIRVDGKILCARRGSEGTLPGLWEFPGGKIEQGETPEDALAREITEELRCEIKVGPRITTTTHMYDFGEVTLTTFFCDLLSGEPQLTEHSEVRWVSPAALSELDWAPADIPAVDLIMSEYTSA